MDEKEMAKALFKAGFNHAEAIKGLIEMAQEGMNGEAKPLTIEEIKEAMQQIGEPKIVPKPMTVEEIKAEYPGAAADYKTVTIMGGPMHGVKVHTTDEHANVVSIAVVAPPFTSYYQESPPKTGPATETVDMTVQPHEELGWIAIWPKPNDPKPPFLCPACGSKPTYCVALTHTFGWRLNCPTHGHFHVSMEMATKYQALHTGPLMPQYAADLMSETSQTVQEAKWNEWKTWWVPKPIQPADEWTYSPPRPSGPPVITMEKIETYAREHGLLSDPVTEPVDPEDIPAPKRSVREEAEAAFGKQKTPDVISDIDATLAEYDEETEKIHAEQAAKMEQVSKAKKIRFTDLTES